MKTKKTLNKQKVKTKDNVVIVKKEKFEIAIRDIKQVACFLDGMEIMMEDDKGRFKVSNCSSKLTNAIQWLNNWGD